MYQNTPKLTYPLPGMRDLLPEMPRQGDSFQSRLDQYLALKAPQITTLNRSRQQMRDGSGRAVRAPWVTISKTEVEAILWDHTVAFLGDRIVPERQSWRASTIGADQARRAVSRAADLATRTFDWVTLEREIRKARRAGHKGRRRKDITVEMVQPYLDSFEGLTLAQAAARLASWEWVTPTGRMVQVTAETMRKRLVEAGFTGAAGTKKVRSRTLHWSVLDGLDGMTQDQQAAELGVSRSTVNRLLRDRKREQETAVSDDSETSRMGRPRDYTVADLNGLDHLSKQQTAIRLGCSASTVARLRAERRRGTCVRSPKSPPRLADAR